MTLAQTTRRQITSFTEQHPYVLPLAGVVVVAAMSGGIAGAIAGAAAAESTTLAALPFTATQAAAMLKFGAQVVPLLL